MVAAFSGSSSYLTHGMQVCDIKLNQSTDVALHPLDGPLRVGERRWVTTFTGAS